MLRETRSACVKLNSQSWFCLGVSPLWQHGQRKHCLPLYGIALWSLKHLLSKMSDPGSMLFWLGEFKLTSPFSLLCMFVQMFSRASGYFPALSGENQVSSPWAWDFKVLLEGATARAAWQRFTLNTRTRIGPFSWQMGDERLNCLKRRNSPIFWVGGAITGLCEQWAVVKGPWPSAGSAVAAAAWGYVSSQWAGGSGSLVTGSEASPKTTWGCVRLRITRSW